MVKRKEVSLFRKPSLMRTSLNYLHIYKKTMTLVKVQYYVKAHR